MPAWQQFLGSECFYKQEALTNKDQLWFFNCFGFICLNPPPEVSGHSLSLTWHVNSMSWFL